MAAWLRLPVQLALRRLLGERWRAAMRGGTEEIRPHRGRQCRRGGILVHRRGDRPRVPGDPGAPGRLMRQDVSPVQQPAAVPRTLGLIDLVLLKVVAIVNVNNVPPTAVFGRASLLLWVLAFVAFFIPEAVAVMVMVRRYPGEGGIYLWTRRLFGEGHGFFSGWCYWVNNLFYVPVLLLYIAGVAAFAAGERGAALIDRPWFAASVAFGWLIAMTVANVRGLAVGKWIQNIGGIGTALAVLLVVVAALAVVASGGTLVPPPADGTGWEMASGFSVMCFAFV